MALRYRRLFRLRPGMQGTRRQSPRRGAACAILAMCCLSLSLATAGAAERKEGQPAAAAQEQAEPAIPFPWPNQVGSAPLGTDAGPRDPRAQTLEVSSEGHLKAVLRHTRPGDTIIVADGTYEGWKVRLPSVISGQDGRPITIRAATPGGVVFRGPSRWRIEGAHVIFAGFVFERSGKETVHVMGDRNRLTGLIFRESGAEDSSFPPIVKIDHGASHNEVDHNTFIGSKSVSITISVPVRAAEGVPQFNHLHHNRFQDIVRLRDNGQEPIQLGTASGLGKSCVHEAKTLVEFNVFLRASGDTELVSNKSSRNVIRHNVAVDSDGGLSLRCGNNTRIEGNILTRTRNGIGISGDGHIVINNLVDDPRVHGILLLAGSRRKNKQGFLPATNALVAHNTILNTGNAIRFAQFDDDGTGLPKGNRIINNLFAAGSQRPSLIAVDKRNPLSKYMEKNEFARNVFWWPMHETGMVPEPRLGAKSNIVADPKIERGDDGLPRLGEGSPARDAAIPGVVQRDLLGRVRRDADGQPDIGAQEVTNR